MTGLHQESEIAHHERKALFMAICKFRVAKTPNDEKHSYMLNRLSGHFYVFRTSDRKIVIMDEPYIPSVHLESQQFLIDRGWQCQHLPSRMSLRVAGKCQPSLWAAPNTQVDSKFILALLEAAKFTGNMVLRESFQAAGHPCTLT